MQAKKACGSNHGDENEHIDRSYYPRHHRIHGRPARNRFPKDRVRRWSHGQARISSFGGLAGQPLPSHPLASVSKREGRSRPFTPRKLNPLSTSPEPIFTVSVGHTNGEPPMNACRIEDPHRKALRDARHRFDPVESKDDPFPQLLERLKEAEAKLAASGGQNRFINDNRK